MWDYVVWIQYKLDDPYLNCANVNLSSRFTECVSTSVYVTEPVKIDHLSTKDHRFCSSLLYDNLITIYTTIPKSSSLLLNLISFFCNLQKWDNMFWTEDISKDITQCHFHSHRRFLHARSHSYNEARHKAFSCLFTGHFLAKTFLIFNTIVIKQLLHWVFQHYNITSIQ